METNTNGNNKVQLQQKKQKWFLLLIFTLLLSTLLVFISITTSSSSTQLLYLRTINKNKKRQHEVPHFVESKLNKNLGGGGGGGGGGGAASSSSPTIPRLAYLISGSAGDGESLMRALKAVYHPRNQYAVHLDLEATLEERMELVKWVENEKVFLDVGNVRVIVRSNLVTYRGPTMVTNTLHAAAILVKYGGDWDWFINLSASDYPLVTQDDMLHTLSSIPRDLNFIEHTSDISWKEFHRARPLIIDPGLYSLRKSEVFWVTEKRSLPTAYKLFTGSAWMMLSRSFVEYCLWGWDNLPRVVLMYYANFLSSPEGYFHTVICNAEEFKNSTVNHDLHFISWDSPPKQHPHFLTLDDYQRMVDSNAPFARKFGKDNPVLDKIDSDILGRAADGYVPGGWFNNEGNANVTAPQTAFANTTDLKPGYGAQRLKRMITGLLSSEKFHSTHCI